MAFVVPLPTCWHNILPHVHTCVPWQRCTGRDLEERRLKMTDLAGRKLGRAGLIEGKLIKKKKKNPPTVVPVQLVLLLPSPGLYQQWWFLLPLGSIYCLSSPEGVFQGGEGQSKSSRIARTSCCQGNSLLGNGSIILGLFFSPHWFCIPIASANLITPQTAEHQPQYMKQHAANQQSPTQSKQEAKGAHQC